MITQINTLGMELVEIQPGEYWMGLEISAEEAAIRFGGAADWYAHEMPRHRVRLTCGFSIGSTQITRGQFSRFVTDSNYITQAEREGFANIWNGEKFAKTAGPSWRNVGFEQTDDHPVVCISYADALAFCDWLSRKEDRRYRLPTEAQWEYGYRAGTNDAYTWGNDPNAGQSWANAADLTARHIFPDWTTFNWSDGFVYTSPVGMFKPNAWGLFDMAGNVWEWCSDWFGPYPTEDQIDPVGYPIGEKRILRGGSWYGAPPSCRAAYRSRVKPDYRGSNAGFRVVRE